MFAECAIGTSNSRTSRSSTNQITALLDEVLLLGSTEIGLRYKPESIGLIELCTELTEDLQFRHSDSHAISFVHQGNCDQAVMDASLLRHILTNLLSNAFKYSPHGGDIQFKLCCQDDTAIFHVQDQALVFPSTVKPICLKRFTAAAMLAKFKAPDWGWRSSKSA